MHLQSPVIKRDFAIIGFVRRFFKHVRKVLARGNVLTVLFILISSFLLSSWPYTAFATVTVTAATGGSSISADTTGGSYTTLTGPTITEGASGDVPSSGTVVLSAPSGFRFNTGATVTATITSDTSKNLCFGFTSTTATPSATTITFTLNAGDGHGTHCHVTFSNIQVQPTAGTPLASGNITDTGTASISGMTSSTNLGTLTEVVGAKNKLVITTQPSATATAGANFATDPVVALEDQYGNTVTTDNSSTISEAVVLSGQPCGGTAGSGTLTSTPSSGSAVASGVMTYTAMQYSAGENIQICFSSAGVTSALSSAITVSTAIISVTITSSGTISYGTLAAGISSSTVPAYTQTAKNDGTGSEAFNIKGQNTACPWTLASTVGTNQYVQEFSTNGGTSWTALTTNYQTFATGIAANGTQNFDLRLTVPSSTTCFNQQSVDVTVQAIAG